MNKKERIKTILEFVAIFAIIMIWNTFVYATYDHMIDFTHTYSIANGLKLYKDFNIVIGPIYPTIMSIFLLIFGKNILVFDIVNSLIVVAIYYIIKRNNKETFAFPIIILFCNILFAKYNTFTLLLFYILYFLERNNHKYKDILIGIILSITIFTKINIGVFLVLPTIILHYKEPKIILKRLLTTAIVSLLIMGIMFIVGILPDFLNYTVFGLFDFANNSNSIHKTGIIYYKEFLFLILTIIYIIINYKKDKTLCYMLCYLIMAYPIFDYSHTFTAIFPTIVYLADKKMAKESDKTKLFCYLISIIFFVASFTSIIVRSVNEKQISKIDCKYKYCSQNSIINNNFDYAHKLNKYLSKNYSDYRVFNFTLNAYFNKLDSHKKIDKFDFIWTGNMGYNGDNTYIKEFSKYCSKNKCLFIIDKKSFTDYKQRKVISLKILKFVDKKYKKEEHLYKNNILIYTNNNIELKK